MLTRNNVKNVAKQLQQYIGEMPDDGAVEVKAVVSGDPAINVVPAPTCVEGGFFYATEVVDFCRGNGLHFWIGIDRTGAVPFIYAHIF